MTEHVYKTLTITGSSKMSIEDAVTTAIARTGESVRSLRWFEIDKIGGHIKDGVVDHYQVTVQIGFTLNE